MDYGFSLHSYRYLFIANFPVKVKLLPIFHPRPSASANPGAPAELHTLQQRSHPEGPPPLISDGWGGIDDALVAVYGLVPAQKVSSCTKLQ